MRYHAKNLKQAFTGSFEFIESMKKANIPFAIVSNSSKQCIENDIKILGFQKILENVSIIASDNIKPRVKPDPFHFMSALSQLGVDVNNPGRQTIIVIGDGSDSDMLGALKLSEQGFKVNAIWTNHGKNVDCSLISKNNFIDIQKTVLEYTHINNQSTIFDCKMI